MQSSLSWRRATGAFVLLALASPALLLAQPPGRSGQGGANAPGAQRGNQALQPLPKGPRAMMLRDWYRVATVSSPAISPDGKRVAMTVTRPVEADNRRHSEVWVVDTDGGEPVRWTTPNTESSNPRWSADGKYLFFSSQRAGGTGNTWAIRLDQPGGEAIQVTGYPTGSTPKDGSFAVSSDGGGGFGGFGGGPFGGGGGGAAAAPPGPDPYAQMPPMARPPYGAITRPSVPGRFDGMQIVDMRYKVNGQNFVPGPRVARTWRAGQLARQNFGETERKVITNTIYSHRSPVVSPDGKLIAFTADAQLRADSVVDLERDSIAKLPYNKARDEADVNTSDIYIIDSNGGTPRKLVEWMGTEQQLTWSPDGSQIAFVGRPSRMKNASIYVVDVNGGTPRNLLPGWQYEPASFHWLPNGTIQFTAEIGGRTAVLNADLSGKSAPTEVIGGRRQIRGVSYDATGSKIAFVATSMNKPTELFIANADGTGERRLTGFNDEVNADVVWSDAERFTYKSVGNMEIEGWLMKPYGYEQGKKYPLVIYIHGGPHSSYGEGWFDEFQNLAAKGMFVLFTNPRGSSGYGAAFTYSTRGRWGMEDYQDIMKAVDLMSVRPDVDSTKMGATGGSYGGFMTTWLATKTTRFKAIETDRTITDWTYWYGSSDAQSLTEFEFFGKPWDNQKLYDELSPIRYVNKVKTPMLIVQSEEDHRTPMGNAEMWFMSLKKQGVPVEMVRYPRSTHDLSRTGEPWLLVDRLGRLRQWFGYWLQGVEPGSQVN